MKTKLITLLALSWTMFASAQTADSYIKSGTNDLALNDWWGADTNFTAALGLSPTNETANALKAVTRLLVLPQTPAGSNFLVALGFPKTNRYLLHVPEASLPEDANDYPVFPANYNSTNIVNFFRTNILMAIIASATNLASVTDPNYTLSLSSNETSIEAVTLDYGDIQLLRALLSAAQFMGYTLNAHNFSVVMPQVNNMFETHSFTWQAALADYPSLLKMQNTADLALSESALTNAIALYLAASDFIRNTRPAGTTNRLFELDTNDLVKEAEFRTDLTNALLSLNAPTEFNTNKMSSTIYAGAYFAGTHPLRSLMPQFNGDTYVNDTLPDYTFGGILPYQPAYLTEAMLRKGLYSYAGIYIGHVDDLTFNDGDAGIFAVFVSTNQQATVVGYDVDSFQNINGAQSGGVAAQFNVGTHGEWQFNSNSLAGVSGYGSIGKDGSFNGELDFTNGDSVSLGGYGQRALENAPGNYCYGCHAAGSLTLRPFQNAAGNYSGTMSLTNQNNGQRVTGKLQAILSAAGQLPFCIFDPSGAQNDGGMGQFGSNNKFITTNATSGDTVSGTLNLATLQITGTVTNGPFNGPFRGTYTLNRSANVPFDVPPVITTNVPSILTLPLGANATFFLVATGSPPMCYQWFFTNGVAIPNAITNTLVLNNLQYGSAGTYSVTINNCAGETNASITLAVTAESTPPVINITNMTTGMVVSNTPFTVRGTSGDNVAVASVFCSLSNSAGAGAWIRASSANSWTNWNATVNLAAGTNTIRAYAVDYSGNVSTTNTVNLNYVVSAILTVSTNGLGSLSPNYNQALLQIGTSYSITASPGTGFMFTNWTGGTNLPLSFITNGMTIRFLMASNLMLQANFVDTNRPALSITNLVSGQRLSNAVFTVKGTAGDNWQVSNVLCQIDGGDWASATNINNWTNWSAGVMLVPGTNTVAAYAVDTSGNLSTTSSVSFQFVVTNQLGVRTVGLGTVSPNYSNAWLEIGRNYSITSAPSGGFVFTNWTVSTNWIGGMVVTGTNLQFMMASNLTLQANFVETNKPTLTITAPTSGQHMTNALTTVMGTASDVWKVNAVWYQLTNAILAGGMWSQATTTNGYTNWSTTLTLAAGTNTVKAYAVNLGGNYSATNSVSFVSSNSFKLQLTFVMGQPLASNGLNFVLQVSTGLAGHIQVSTNLVDWSTLTNFVGTNATINFRDAAAMNNSDRFYRAVIP